MVASSAGGAGGGDGVGSVGDDCSSLAFLQTGRFGQHGASKTVCDHSQRLFSALVPEATKNPAVDTIGHRFPLPAR